MSRALTESGYSFVRKVMQDTNVSRKAKAQIAPAFMQATKIVTTDWSEAIDCANIGMKRRYASSLSEKTERRIDSSGFSMKVYGDNFSKRRTAPMPIC